MVRKESFSVQGQLALKYVGDLFNVQLPHRLYTGAFYAALLHFQFW